MLTENALPQLGDIHYVQSFPSGHKTTGRPPLVLIHGAGGSHLHWPLPVRRLPGETVYALDLPGHGRSGGVGRQIIADYAGAVLDWLDGMLINQAILVGHSMGGAIAQTLALTAPENVAGLVLVGTGARLPVNEAILQGTLSESAFPDTVAQIIKWAFALNAPAQLTRLAHQRMLEVRPTVVHADFLACSTFDVTETIGAVVTPALVIWGAVDKMVPERASRFLAEKIAGATLKVIPDAGHMVMLEQPQAVAEAVAGFMRRYWGEPLA